MEGAATADMAAVGARPAPYFSVSTRKFVVLWICTFGLYGIYWFYRHWQIIKQQERLDIVPLLRAIFQIFFVYALLEHANGAARTYDVKAGIPAGPLAIAFVVLSFAAQLPDPYWLVSLGSILTLLPAQALMNRVNARVAPQAPMNDRFSGANVAVVVVGGLLVVVAIIGTVAPLISRDAPADQERSPKPQRSAPVVIAPDRATGWIP